VRVKFARVRAEELRSAIVRVLTDGGIRSAASAMSADFAS
jgi:UDP:flavonoid glycosyltransferase YjiC (YdhE family)